MRSGVAAVVLALGLGQTVQAENPPARIALVIGNTEYQWRTPLDNAAPDASQIARQMEKLDFTVTYRKNLTKSELDATLAEFGNRLKAVGPQAVSFFYYSGHAAQDLAQSNYLIPVDARANSPADFRNEASTLYPLFADMARTGNAVNLIVLDACRDWFRGDTSVEVPKGLHDMGRQGNMFVAMATSPNTVADDGGKDGSPFSRRLLEGLALQAKLSVSELFDDVQGKVYADTSGSQAPEFINGMARAPRWSLAAPPPPVGTVLALAPSRADGPLPRYLLELDRGRLLAFTQGKTSVVDTLLERRDLLARAGLTTKLRLAYFLAAISYESDGFRFKAEENFNYSASRLRQIFPRVFPDERSTQGYVGNPEKIANAVYANRLGNGPESSGDGWRFRGRGYIALTGRDNYRRVGERIGVDLVANPDLLHDPEVNLAVALAIWSNNKLHEISDADDMALVARRLSGAVYNPSSRVDVLKRAKVALELE